MNLQGVRLLDPELGQRVSGWVLVLMGAVIPLSVSGAGVLTGVAVLLGLTTGLYARTWRAVLGFPVALTALVLFAWLCVGLTYTEAPLDEAFHVLKKYRELLLMPLLLPFFLDARRRRWGLYAFIAAMLATLAVSYVIGIGMLLHPDGKELEAIVFKHRITQNTLMAMAVFWMTLQALRPGRWRWAWTALILLALVDMFVLVGGRTGHVVMFALLGLVLFHRFGRRGLVLGTGAVLLAVIVLYLVSAPFRGRVDEIQDGLAGFQAGEIETSTSFRLSYYENTLELIAQRPLLGFGTGGFARAYRTQVAGTSHPLTENPHNEYLLIGSQLGIFGGALFAYLLWLQWRYSRQLDGDERLMARALVVTMAVGCLLNSFLLDSTEGHIYAYLTALLYAPLLHRESAV